MSFYEAARQYEHEALQVIVSVLRDAKQPASLRLAAANDLLDRAYGRPPVAIDATTRELSLKRSFTKCAGCRPIQTIALTTSRGSPTDCASSPPRLESGNELRQLGAIRGN
jgi:hypothetical protein